MHEQEKEAFLNDEFFSLTLMATVQRAGAYVQKDTPERDGRIEPFQASLRCSLEAMASEYIRNVSEDKHCENICFLSKNLSRDHATALKDGEFRIGLAQKALNLHLKYRWCRGLIPIPPHCPFDSQVINQLRDCRGMSWTRLNSIDAYKRLVEAARNRANENGYSSIAEWELAIFNKLQKKRESHPIKDKKLRALKIIQAMIASKHKRKEILDAMTVQLQCSRANAAYYFDRVHRRSNGFALKT